MSQMSCLPYAEYRYGFSSDVESEVFPKGLDEGVVRKISSLRGEPTFLLEFRLSAYRKWLKLEEPSWASLVYPPIDYGEISYFSAPKRRSSGGDLSGADPEVLAALRKLSLPLEEGEESVAMDVVFDSVSVGTTWSKKLEEQGIILCSLLEAVGRYPELIRRYLGSVVSAEDNFFSCLNAAVFTDGSFVYVPKGVRCPMELSTYFRINEKGTGQFERTLIIADEGSHVSYLEGCTAPVRDHRQLHAAVVELVALEGAEIKYSTVQNWYSGDPETGSGGIYNFVTKRGLCAGRRSKISWTQVEVGAAITWKYPSCILQGEESVGEFYSIALTRGQMQADTGSKMIHLGRGSRSTIISKGIATDRSSNSYRGMVRVGCSAEAARNYTQCDSMLVGKECSAHTFPTLELRNGSALLEHEASTTHLDEEKIFYCMRLGISREEAIGLIIKGFCQRVLQELPLEFAVEAQQLLALKLDPSMG